MPKTPRDLTYLRWNGEKASNMTHNNSLNPLDSDLSLNVHIHFKIPESSLVLINLLAAISYTFTVLPFFIIISSESEISRIFPIAGLACAGATSSGNGSSSSTYGVGLTGGSWQRGGKTSGEFSWGMWCKKNRSTINCSENSCPSSCFFPQQWNFTILRVILWVSSPIESPGCSPQNNLNFWVFHLHRTIFRAMNSQRTLKKVRTKAWGVLLNDHWDNC